MEIKMNCENNFCVYWEDENCILDNVSLDVLGCCKACILVEISDQDLKQARNRFRSLVEAKTFDKV